MTKLSKRLVKPCPPKPSYEVGYGRPPQATRFPPGQSGNPKGRPKGTLNLSTLVARALDAKVVVTENGRRRTKSKLEVSITQVANKAASGDLKATQMLLNLLPLLESPDAGALGVPDLLADRELARRIAARLAAQSPNSIQETGHE